MSIPNPVNVSPSTTVVEVNPLLNPYTPVQLNTVVYPGQVVTILDATSSFGAVTTPIVISTAATNTFLDGTISTLINQPQGFVTAQSYNTNQWAFLNSFPFRNQTVSAGLLNLTTSTLYSQVGSTLIEYVSSLEVQNLFVTGNFVQSQGIQLNTNVSSLGTVELLSSLEVWGNTYLSSSLDSLGPMFLYSSLTVEGNFSTNTLGTASTMYISGSLISIGAISTPFITVNDELKGTRLEVIFFDEYELIELEDLLAEPNGPARRVAANIAGSVSNSQTLRVLSSLYTGGSLETNDAQIFGNASFFSSASFFQNANVVGILSTLQDVSIQGRLGVAGPLSIGSELQVTGNILVNGSMTIGDSLTIGENLITSSLIANTFESLGDYKNLSTIAQISSIYAEEDVGAGFVSSSSTFIGGFLSTFGNLVVGKDITFQGGLFVFEGISTMSSVSLNQGLVGFGSFSTLTNFTGSTLSTSGKLTVDFSTILNLDTASTFISGSLLALGNLFCDGTLTVSSITLPSSLLANTISTGQLFVGTQGITSNLKIPSALVSSATVGYILNSQYSFDISGSILLDSNYVSPSGSVPVTLTLLSTALYSVGKKTNFYLPPLTYIITEGMGVGMEGVSTLEVNPLAYFTNETNAYKVVSSGTIYSGLITGSLIGNGSQISNVPYPAQLSALTLLVSAENIYPFNPLYNWESPENAQWLNDGAMYLELNFCNASPALLQASTLYTSSLLVDNSKLIMRSTMTIGSLVISGNNYYELNTGQNSIQTSNDKLFVNDVIFDRAIPGVKRVLVNEDLLSNASGEGFSLNANLGVYTTLAANTLGDSYEFNIETFKASQVLASNIIGFNGVIQGFPSFDAPYVGGIYISSGIISTLTGKFFIGEDDEYDRRFNIVQPYRSTLQFNSTLFVNREFSSVGINTKPNFNLDVETVFSRREVIAGPSSIISNKISLDPSFSTLYFAFGPSNATTSNMQWSANGSNWSNFSFQFGTYSNTALFSPGLSQNSNQATPFGGSIPEQNTVQFLLGGQALLNSLTGVIRQISQDPGANIFFELFSGFDTIPPNLFYSIATDGVNSIATGIQFSNSFSGSRLFRYLPGEFGGFPSWTSIDGSVFPAFTFPTFYDIGGYSIIYGGVSAPVWIVVGVGANGPMYRSVNGGQTWTLVNLGNIELRSIISLTLPENGGTVFLTGGCQLVPSGNTYVRSSGLVYTSRDFGTNWTGVGTFNGTVYSLATDGKKVVAATEGTVANQTLFFSLLTSSNTYNWQLCQGDLFASRANSVIYTGSLWVAGGDSGFRHSYDGISWFNPGTFTTEISNVSFMSNAATSINITNGESTIFFQQSPALDVQRLISVPTISYYPSSILNLNNACILDQKNNFIVPGAVNTISPLADTTFHSTFYTQEAYISSVVSTNQIQIGAYRAGIQYIL